MKKEEKIYLLLNDSKKYSADNLSSADNVDIPSDTHGRIRNILTDVYIEFNEKTLCSLLTAISNFKIRWDSLDIDIQDNLKKIISIKSKYFDCVRISITLNSLGKMGVK